MKKIQKISIAISVFLGALLLGTLVFASFWVPTVVNSMIDVKDNFGNRDQIGNGGRLLVIIDTYAMVAVAVTAIILMFLLLRVVYKHEVFGKATGRLISGISWCCFAEGILSLLLITVFQLVVCFAIAACFLGLSLRVVKHVIQEATLIKSENDYTI